MTAHRTLPVCLPALLAVLTLAISTPCLGQSRDLGRFVTWMYEDPGTLSRQANQRTAVFVTGGLVAVSALSLLDQTATDELQEGYHGPFKAYTDLANRLGDPIIAAPVVGVFGISLLTRNRRLQDAAFTSLQSLLYAGLTTIVLKQVAGRYRPADSDTPYRFEPFSGRTSFPSGHVTAATAILMPWAMYYPHPVTWALVAAGAGGTALARIAKTKHWASDVVAGGLIGASFGFHLARLHQKAVVPARFTARVGARQLVMTVHF